RIEQVIGNLVGNAIKFTQAGGRIDVSAELDTDGKCVCIAVRDNGCGIAEDKLQHVFERLFQINPEQSFTSGDTSNGGLGLGLTISKELVKLHGGEISVESEVGKGSTFFIVLPVKRCKEKDQ
ncbi:MAG: histidine kinase, partial [Gammaproteobacteria bacterium]|nr:histidine kinase [Gammaproteobacteria bacterium]